MRGYEGNQENQHNPIRPNIRIQYQMKDTRENAGRVRVKNETDPGGIKELAKSRLK